MEKFKKEIPYLLHCLTSFCVSWLTFGRLYRKEFPCTGMLPGKLTVGAINQKP